MAKYTTFGERRRAIRTLRATHRRMRDELDARNGAEDVSLTLPREDYDACRWALERIKVWIPALDDEQEVIEGEGEFSRQCFLYSFTAFQPREHFSLKGRPVFVAAD